MNLLLLSNSRNPDSGYLEHALPWLEATLSGVKTLAFVPYAAVRFGYAEYEKAVSDAIGHLVEVRSVHRGPSPVEVLGGCDAVAVGGGNTFHLLYEMHRHGMIKAIRERVAEGMPYVGWSAGSNVACPTIRTTNDMPIVEPESFRAIGLVPYQINPHYLDAHPDRHMGETREERLEEFTRANPGITVVGLREGSALWIRGDDTVLLGSRSARIFRDRDAPRELAAGSALNVSIN